MDNCLQCRSRSLSIAYALVFALGFSFECYAAACSPYLIVSVANLVIALIAAACMAVAVKDAVHGSQ